MEFKVSHKIQHLWYTFIYRIHHFSANFQSACGLLYVRATYLQAAPLHKKQTSSHLFVFPEELALMYHSTQAMQALPPRISASVISQFCICTWSFNSSCLFPRLHAFVYISFVPFYCSWHFCFSWHPAPLAHKVTESRLYPTVFSLNHFNCSGRSYLCKTKVTHGTKISCKITDHKANSCIEKERRSLTKLIAIQVLKLMKLQKKKKNEVQNYKKLKNILSQQPGFCQLQQFFINV